MEVLYSIVLFVVVIILYQFCYLKYEDYKDKMYFKSPEALAAQKKCDEYNNGPGKIIRERINKLRQKYGHYAVTDELPLEDLRKVISELSKIGYDLRKIYRGHKDLFIGYLTFNDDR